MLAAAGSRVAGRALPALVPAGPGPPPWSRVLTAAAQRTRCSPKPLPFLTPLSPRRALLHGIFGSRVQVELSPDPGAAVALVAVGGYAAALIDADEAADAAAGPALAAALRTAGGAKLAVVGVGASLLVSGGGDAAPPAAFDASVPRPVRAADLRDALRPWFGDAADAADTEGPAGAGAAGARAQREALGESPAGDLEVAEAAEAEAAEAAAAAARILIVEGVPCPSFGEMR